MWPWSRGLTSLSLSFPICERRVKVATERHMWATHGKLWWALRKCLISELLFYYENAIRLIDWAFGVELVLVSLSSLLLINAGYFGVCWLGLKGPSVAVEHTLCSVKGMTLGGMKGLVCACQLGNPVISTTGKCSYLLASFLHHHGDRQSSSPLFFSGGFFLPIEEVYSQLLDYPYRETCTIAPIVCFLVIVLT